MLIICTDEENRAMQQQCSGECVGCVFEKVRCPIEHCMIITNEEVNYGKELEVKTSRH